MMRKILIWSLLPYWGPFYVVGFVLAYPLYGFRAGMRKAVGF